VLFLIFSYLQLCLRNQEGGHIVALYLHFGARRRDGMVEVMDEELGMDERNCVPLSNDDDIVEVIDASAAAAAIITTTTTITSTLTLSSTSSTTSTTTAASFSSKRTPEDMTKGLNLLKRIINYQAKIILQ
jgi:hypothetical protein